MSMRLTLEQKHEVARLYATGNFSQRQLAAKFHVSKGTIQNIVKGLAAPPKSGQVPPGIAPPKLPPPLLSQKR